MAATMLISIVNHYGTLVRPEAIRAFQYQIVHFCCQCLLHSAEPAIVKNNQLIDMSGIRYAQAICSSRLCRPVGHCDRYLDTLRRRRQTRKCGNRRFHGACSRVWVDPGGRAARTSFHTAGCADFERPPRHPNEFRSARVDSASPAGCCVSFTSSMRNSQQADDLETTHQFGRRLAETAQKFKK